jgi:hypothetical protein
MTDANYTESSNEAQIYWFGLGCLAMWLSVTGPVDWHTFVFSVCIPTSPICFSRMCPIVCQSHINCNSFDT